MAKYTSKCVHWSATPVPAASCAQLPFGGVSLLSMRKITIPKVWETNLKFLTWISPPPHNFGLRLQVRKPPLPNPSFPYEIGIVGPKIRAVPSRIQNVKHNLVCTSHNFFCDILWHSGMSQMSHFQMCDICRFLSHGMYFFSFFSETYLDTTNTRTFMGSCTRRLHLPF